jgi:hypothetical protein
VERGLVVASLIEIPLEIWSDVFTALLLLAVASRGCSGLGFRLYTSSSTASLSLQSTLVDRMLLGRLRDKQLSQQSQPPLIKHSNRANSR